MEATEIGFARHDLFSRATKSPETERAYIEPLALTVRYISFPYSTFLPEAPPRHLIAIHASNTSTMSTNTPILRPAPDGTLPLPTFLGVLSQYGTFRSLARCLDTRDMFNLRLVSKELVDNYKAYIHVRWDPNRRQKRFVNKPEDFRSMMGRCDAIISGSFVLQFLDDVTWLESGIDIFMPKGNATDFGDYFVEKEGYKFV